MTTWYPSRSNTSMSMVRRWTGSSSAPGAGRRSASAGGAPVGRRQARRDCDVPWRPGASSLKLSGPGRRCPTRCGSPRRSGGGGATTVRRPAPRAQATAALIGVTWLTTTTSPPAVAGARAVGGEQLLAGAGDPGVHLGQRLAPGGRKPGSRRHCRHTSAGTSRQGLALELAVVDLDPAVVDLGRHLEAEQGGGVAGPGQGAGAQRADRRAGAGPGTATAWARPVSVSSASVRPSSRPAALAVDSPWRTRTSTAGSGPQSRATRMRPHWSQVTTLSGGMARMRSTSTADSSRWHPSQRWPTGAPPRPPSGGPAASRSDRPARRAARRPRRRGRPWRWPAPHRSRPGPPPPRPAAP